MRPPSGSDTRAMVWPVAALAVFLLAFVVVYGTVVQARVGAGWTRPLAGSSADDEESSSADGR